MDYREPDWVAERLGIDKNTVYRLLQEGTIPALQLGRKWLISEQRLEQWLSEETDKQTSARREARSSASRLARGLENFTARARQALRQAHAEARRYAHQRLDSAHLLLGLALDEQSAATRALGALGINSDELRLRIEAQLKPGGAPPARRLGRTAETKRAIRLAGRLALRQAPGQALAPISTEHLLMGILFSRRGLGHEILVDHGITRQSLRRALRETSPQAVNGDHNDP